MANEKTMFEKLEEVLNKRTEKVLNSVKNNEEDATFQVIADSVATLGGNVYIDEGIGIEVTEGIDADGICLDVDGGGYHVIYASSLDGMTEYAKKVIGLTSEEKTKLANVLYNKVMATL